MSEKIFSPRGYVLADVRLPLALNILHLFAGKVVVDACTMDTFSFGGFDMRDPTTMPVSEVCRQNSSQAPCLTSCPHRDWIAKKGISSLSECMGRIRHCQHIGRLPLFGNYCLFGSQMEIGCRNASWIIILLLASDVWGVANLLPCNNDSYFNRKFAFL